MSWKQRSRKYDKLAWAKERGLINAVLKAADLSGDEVCLDVGCGTGIMTRALKSITPNVIGIDSSQDMMDKADVNTSYCLMDCRDIKWLDQHFDRVIARMMLHHVLDDPVKALSECHRVLRKGGRLVVCEGVPPHPSAEQFFTEVFGLKEKRLVFSKNRLLKMMSDAGFRNVGCQEHWQRRNSVTNWLSNADLDTNAQKSIMNMYRTMDKDLQDKYNVTYTTDDVLIDCKFLILTGVKE